MATVCEIEQGFLLYYFERGEPNSVANRAIHSAEVLDLDDALYKQRGKPEPSDSFRGLPSIFGFRQSEALRFQKSHPLCPMGYEEFLRALGDALDRRSARAVQISELEDRVYVEYTVDRADFVIRNGQRMALPGRRQESYGAAQIVELVRRCREHAADLVQRSGQHLSFNPMDVSSYLIAAPVLEEHGQQREAEDLYRKALSLAPDHPEIHFRLASHARRRGDRKAALKHVEQALRQNSRDGRFHHLLGRLKMERNSSTEAAQALERAVACEPDNKIYQFHLAQVYERLGRIGEARAVLSHREAPAPVAPSPAVATEAAPLPKQDVAPAPISVVEVPPAPLAAEVVAPSVEPAVATASSSGFGSVEQPDTSFVPSVNPFASATPSWDALPPAPVEQEAAFPQAEPATALPEPPAVPTVDGLPVLGLSLAAEWEKPASFLGAASALDVPADSAVIGASLPLAGVNLDQPATTGVENGAWALPVAAPQPAPAHVELAPTDSEDAVQLAAAILRAQEQVQLEPQRADLHRKLGFLLAKQGRSEEAAAEFRRAVECGRRRMAS
jgi:tetratricopeptide (TPR) repeat protein